MIRERAAATAEARLAAREHAASPPNEVLYSYTTSYSLVKLWFVVTRIGLL